MIKLNDAFVKTIIGVYGDKGAQWVKKLPHLIESCMQMWKLFNVKTVPNLTYNYVAYAQQSNKRVILKIRCSEKELAKEISALQAFADYGAIRILFYDYTLSAMILECIEPGISLISLFPDQDTLATEIAAQVLCKLHQAPIPEDQSFLTLKQMLPKFDKEFSDLSLFIERARMLRAHLLATQTREILLHGDFHHDNILLGEDNTWFAIDPEGIIGDPGYDMGLFIRNPSACLLDQPEIEKVIAKRIKYFSEFFKYDRERLYQWTYLQTISSAYWSLEDGLGIEKHYTFLELLEKIHFKKTE